jgi:hypothetical protein
MMQRIVTCDIKQISFRPDRKLQCISTYCYYRPPFRPLPILEGLVGVTTVINSSSSSPSPGSSLIRPPRFCSGGFNKVIFGELSIIHSSSPRSSSCNGAKSGGSGISTTFPFPFIGGGNPNLGSPSVEEGPVVDRDAERTRDRSGVSSTRFTARSSFFALGSTFGRDFSDFSSRVSTEPL